MKSRSETLQIALGLVVMAGFAYLAYLLFAGIFSVFVPEPKSAEASVALAAYYEETADRSAAVLRVTGTVLEQGKPLREGRVRLSVRNLRESSHQTVVVEVKDGRFDAGDQPAFRIFGQRAPVHVVAEVSKADAPRLAREETYLHAFPPTSPATVRVVMFTIVALSAVFFWAFTGAATQGKNQIAIIFSYCVMVVFLLLPFAAFWMVGRYQALAEAAWEVAWSTPIGVLPAVPRTTSDGRPADNIEREWVLNIGGTVIDETGAAPNGGTPQTPAVSPARAATQPAVLPAAAVPAGSAPLPQPDAAPGESQSAAPPADAAPAAAPPRYVIEGGLVIPLYVLVLSIIGGAINMTRALPVYQREAQGLGSPLAMIQIVGQRVMATVGGDAAARNPQADLSVTATADDGAAASLDVQVEAPPDREHATPEQRAAFWRQGLIEQHMYLLSAPFLAIAVFYLFDWLDLRKKPLLVLVSLSVGLISDKILNAILSVVSSMLDRTRTTVQLNKPAKT